MSLIPIELICIKSIEYSLTSSSSQQCCPQCGYIIDVPQDSLSKYNCEIENSKSVNNLN